MELHSISIAVFDLLKQMCSQNSLITMHRQKSENVLNHSIQNSIISETFKAVSLSLSLSMHSDNPFYQKPFSFNYKV